MTRTRSWTLQTRLMVTVLGIVSILIIAIGFAMTTALRATLDSQLDDEVRGLAIRTQLDMQSVGDPTLSAAEILALTRAMPGTLLITTTTSGLSGAYVTEKRSVVLSESDVSQVLQHTEILQLSAPTQLALTDVTLNHTTFRTTVTLDGSAVVGLADTEMQRQIGALLWAVTLVTLVGLAFLAIATVVVVRAGLRPLRAVVATAERVATLKLDAGQGAITERVADGLTDPTSEIGRVGAALNTMLDHVDASLQARARNEALMRRFVADASHELRTPLTSIRGYSELSLRAPDNPESTATALERIQAQSVRMSELVEDLLLLARLDEGQELVVQDVDLTPLAIDAVSDARAGGQEHHWAIDVTGEPVMVRADPSRLQQIIVNLLANARTHTPAGTDITLGLTTDGSDAVLTVHDTGGGIAPDVRESIFERFTRADASRARKTGGTGLGLSIAHAIAQAHGGTLAVESEPGNTTFTLRLPLAA